MEIDIELHRNRGERLSWIHLGINSDKWSEKRLGINGKPWNGLDKGSYSCC